MRYDLLRRVLVVVVVGLLIPNAALLSEPNPDSTRTDQTHPASVSATTDAVVKSHARIVWLSFVKGAVTVKRPGSAEAEPAPVNTPLVEGAELSTSAASSAEVQFENGSTARLSANSKMLFAQLALDADGDKLTGLTLEQGIAGFRFFPQHQDSYKVKIADATLVSYGKTELHTAFAAGTMRMQVVAGSVTISAHSSSMTLGKGQLLEYQASDASEAAKSHARVVRLSYLSGTVMARRPGSAEEEKVVLNTPIQEGFELFTPAESYAEVEFENGSTARMGENSKLLFHQLALDGNGNKLNGLTLEQGYATFHFAPERNSPPPTKLQGRDGVVHFLPTSKDAYRVKVADATVTADGKCEFRTDLDNQHFRVEVFHGTVDVTTATQSAQLGDGKVLEYNPSSAEVAFHVQRGITKDNWDRWTAQRDQQVLLTEKDEPVHPLGPTYGWSDLNTFGEWIELPGRGLGWSPYSRAGWSPYTNGQWNWYSGYGWTWISGDPWGWVTDHCGTWDFDASFGWYWMNPMFGCGLWEPSLVSWYSGPGWLGWAPRGRPGTGTLGPGRPGPGGHPHPGHLPRGLVAVPAALVQNRQMITPQTVNTVRPTGGSPIEHPPFGPGARPASLANLPAGAGTAPKGGTAVATAPPASGSGTGLASGFATRHGSAPPTILMGGNAARESALLARGHSGHQPLRAFEGNTLGGRLAVRGSPGEFRGTAFTGGRRGNVNGVGGPVITGPAMSHSFNGPAGGAILSHGSGGGGHSMGGGGYSGSAGHSGGYSGGGGSSSGGGHSGGGGGGFSGGGGGGGHSGGGGGFSGGGGGSSGGGGSAGGGGGGGGHH